MSSDVKRALAVTAVAFLLAPSLFALMQQADEFPLPAGKGRDTVVSACSTCHALSKVTDRRQSRSEWESTVNTMMERGARLGAEEAKAVVDYLAEHLAPLPEGQGSVSAHAAAAENEPARGGGLPEGPGRDMVAAKCSQCHGEGMWRDLRQAPTKWEGTVYRMVGKGALWTQDEIDTMTRYLGTAFGPQGSSK
jgi:cytochrome c5